MEFASVHRSAALPPGFGGAARWLTAWCAATTLLAAADLESPWTRKVEEEVYRFVPADNGAGPMWCAGSTCLVRAGDRVFAAGLETIPDAKPLNNCRWLLYERTAQGWTLAQRDSAGRTREPSPLAIFPDGRLFLSANPTLSKAESGGGPARPQILQFDITNAAGPYKTILPGWQGAPEFTEHSYRSFAADGPGRELILFQNIGYTHAEWAFLDSSGKWSAQGQLRWPIGAEYPKPEPIRVCYPNVALKRRAVHFCGVSDIIEPYPEWRAFKKQITGREWDYDFRRLFYCWTPDITRQPFTAWIEIASRDKTCGWIMPGDLWIAPDGTAHLLWSERALDERLRPKFFPDARQSHSLGYAQVRDGRILLRRTLFAAEEGRSAEIPSNPRFHITPDERLYVVYYAGGTGSGGRPVSENRVLRLVNGEPFEPQSLPLQKPFTSFFTATPRAGSPPSNLLELLGQRAGEPNAIAYARLSVP